MLRPALFLSIAVVTFGFQPLNLTFMPTGKAVIGLVPGGIAQGQIAWEQGWHVLKIDSDQSSGATFEEQMYAAGYLEGALSAELIRDHELNVLAALLDNGTTTVPEGLGNFLLEQHQWTVEQVQQFGNTSQYWNYIGGLVSQIEGLLAGSNFGARERHQRVLNLADILFMVSGGDVPAILAKLDPKTGFPDFDKLTPERVEIEVMKLTRCSALVRALPDLSDIFASHATWWNYGTMLRVYKLFNLPIPTVDADGNISGIERVRQGFSSYPGVLSSQDDFYVTSRGMALLQTTNSVFNVSLYQAVKPESLLSWHRVRLANELSTSGPEWIDHFTQHASGTYPNQYMIIDYKLFTPGQPLLPHTLTVVEEIPTLIESADLTMQLANGYFPSYNIPFFQSVYELSGNADFAATHGLQYSYQLSPRAIIFRRDAPAVFDYQAFQNIMRSNNYKEDPASKGNPLWAICARGDFLNPPEPHGCIDAKTTNAEMVMRLEADAISGPTRGLNDAQWTPFDWTEQQHAMEKQSHVGQPQTFDFQFVKLSF